MWLAGSLKSNNNKNSIGKPLVDLWKCVSTSSLFLANTRLAPMHTPCAGLGSLTQRASCTSFAHCGNSALPSNGLSGRVCLLETCHWLPVPPFTVHQYQHFVAPSPPTAYSALHLLHTPFYNAYKPWQGAPRRCATVRPLPFWLDKTPATKFIVIRMQCHHSQC